MYKKSGYYPKRHEHLHSPYHIPEFDSSWFLVRWRPPAAISTEAVCRLTCTSRPGQASGFSAHPHTLHLYTSFCGAMLRIRFTLPRLQEFKI